MTDIVSSADTTLGTGPCIWPERDLHSSFIRLATKVADGFGLESLDYRDDVWFHMIVENKRTFVFS
jgi:hypothetical protein